MADKAKAAPARSHAALGEDLQRDLKLARALGAQDPSSQHSALGSAMSAVENRLKQDGQVAASLLKLAEAQRRDGQVASSSRLAEEHRMTGAYSRADTDALLKLGKTTMLRRRSYGKAGGAGRSDPCASLRKRLQTYKQR